MVAHAFNPSTREPEAGGFLSYRPAWSTEGVPGQSMLCRETSSQKTQKGKAVNSYSCLWLELVPQVIMLASISRPARLALS